MNNNLIRKNIKHRNLSFENLYFDSIATHFKGSGNSIEI